MAFDRDTDIIEEIVRSLDPSFGTVDRGEIDALICALRQADGAYADRYLLTAMRLLALGRNGHSRVIPNAAIRVFPLRFVAIGGSVYLTDGASSDLLDHRLVAVNGLPAEDLLTDAKPLLAGTPARQRAIGALLFAWPAALEALGAGRGDGSVAYTLSGPEGEETTFAAVPDGLIRADRLYPTREGGGLRAASEQGRWVECDALNGIAWHIRLRDFHCPDGTALEDELEEAARVALSAPHRPIVFDLRGNRGGDFLKTLSFIEAIARGWRGEAAVVLVDKFTFSAAIVFVAILTRKLEGRLSIVGEAMGDAARFHAEGNTAELAETGAAVRYSTAFHDWETGQADPSTPPAIAEHLVAAGPLLPDQTVDITARDLRHGLDPQLDAARHLFRT